MKPGIPFIPGIKSLLPSGCLGFVAKETGDPAMVKKALAGELFMPPIKTPREIETLLETLGKVESCPGERSHQSGGHLGGRFRFIPVYHQHALPCFEEVPGEERAGKSLADNEKIGFHRGNSGAGQNSGDVENSVPDSGACQ